jgi:uncharacterized protein GlcG (DUF336 family)
LTWFKLEIYITHDRGRKMKLIHKTTIMVAVLCLLVSASAHSAGFSCAELPKWNDLLKKLQEAKNDDNGGFELNVWGSIVNRDGVVCAVAYTGPSIGDQWPGSRVISAQKANTANAFSLDRLALSTANLYTATQPGGTLYGLQHSNPIDTAVAYKGTTSNYGKSNDPMVGNKIGGVNVFAGGLALYNNKGEVIGGIGVSGDTSCADHAIAWRLRSALGLDYVSSGVATREDTDPSSGGTAFIANTDHPDNIVYDINTNGVSATGWGHPLCAPRNEEHDNHLKAIAANLPGLP